MDFNHKQLCIMQGQIHGLVAVLGAAIEFLPRSRIEAVSKELERAFETSLALVLASADPAIADHLCDGIEQVRSTLAEVLALRHDNISKESRS